MKGSGAQSADVNIDPISDDRDFILSQDFFCTPDYITPDCQNIPNNLDCNMNMQEEVPCPKSPEKVKTVKSKRPRMDGMPGVFNTPNTLYLEEAIELPIDSLGIDEINTHKQEDTGSQNNVRYVPQSAVALRCRVMAPPCADNPFSKNASETVIDPFGSYRSKHSGFFGSIIGGDIFPRYRSDFLEIEQIGTGNFSCVYKAKNRIDGTLYAIKKSTRLLTQETQRKEAVKEVQALASLGYYEHVVGYHTSWFEDNQLYIQLELCDHSLSLSKESKLYTEGEVLEILYQLSKALQFIHGKGMAHLDVKPDNIYVKNGVFKLGDFGCATRLDGSLPIEEGDARYMPHEILNDNYDDLDKVDIFSLGVSMYELVRGSALPASGHVSLNLREGKIPLFPSHSVHFQNLLKAMMDPDPLKRPSAKELVEAPIFDKNRSGKVK